jgi:heme-degrading monooxygenase HmoA
LPDRFDKGEETMHARVSLYEIASGGSADAAVKAFEGAVDPVLEMEGNQGATFLVDRDNGKAVSITYWDSEEHLQSSVERANKVRQGAADAGGLSILSVDHYEVALEAGR